MGTKDEKRFMEWVFSKEPWSIIKDYETVKAKQKIVKREVQENEKRN